VRSSKKTSKQIQHFFIGLLLCISVIFLSCSIAIRTWASTSVSVSVSNSAPEIIVGPVLTTFAGGGEMYSDGTISNLVAGDSRTVYIEGIVRDINGQQDVENVRVVMHRSDSASSCVESGDRCIKNVNCNLSMGGNINNVLFSCPLTLPYYMDATDALAGIHSNLYWIVTAIATDDDGEQDVNNSRTIEVRSLLGLDIPTSISFGTRAMNSETSASNNVYQTISQWGNVQQDVRVKMISDGYSCSGAGSIPKENMKWATADVGFSEASSVEMTQSYVDTDFGIGKRTGIAPVTKPFYWNISIPYGVQGTCTATLDMLAKNSNIP
jgi:hypothetical protein